MAIKTLYFSHVDYNWQDHPSQLLTSENFISASQATDLQDYHTSLEDIKSKNLGVVLKLCISLDVSKLDIKKYYFDFWEHGRIINEIFQNKQKLTHEFDWSSYSIDRVNPISCPRTTDAPVLWTSDCSVTEGVGVGPTEAWPYLLSQKLNIPLINLAIQGGSNRWAVDRVLRSDVRTGDTVVFGVTSFLRIEISTELWKQDPVPFAKYAFPKYKSNRWWPDEYFFSGDLHLKHLQSLLQLLNFCQKVGAKLIIANLIDALWTPVFFRDTECYINLVNTVDTGNIDCGFIDFIDLGKDNIHPGPKTHAIYYQKILEKIQQI